MIDNAKVDNMKIMPPVTTIGTKTDIIMMEVKAVGLVTDTACLKDLIQVWTLLFYNVTQAVKNTKYFLMNTQTQNVLMIGVLLICLFFDGSATPNFEGRVVQLEKAAEPTQ